MTDKLPAPLTPHDCDLRDFAFMPLDVVRLRDSDLVAMESAEAFRAAVMLWCASWHQLPAASLPDDDRVLANLAGYGRVIKEWQKERDGALRGWVKCSDGRLYHPVVAEKAVEAWRGKLERQWRTECARIKKHAQRHQIPLEPPEFDAWLEAGRPQGHALPVPEDKKGLSRGQQGVSPAPVPGETPSKGQGEGQGTGTGTGTVLGIPGANAPLPPAAPAAPAPTPAPTPPVLELVGGDEIPACPLKHLVALFAMKAPTLPKPRYELWKDSAGAEAMRQRWKWLLSKDAVREDGSRYATTAAEATEWFGRFFEVVDESDFLSGRNGAWKNCDLAWLMKRENFMKVVQGNYTNDDSEPSRRRR